MIPNRNSAPKVLTGADGRKATNLPVPRSTRPCHPPWPSEGWPPASIADEVGDHVQLLADRFPCLLGHVAGVAFKEHLRPVLVQQRLPLAAREVTTRAPGPRANCTYRVPTHQRRHGPAPTPPAWGPAGPAAGSRCRLPAGSEAAWTALRPGGCGPTSARLASVHHLMGAFLGRGELLQAHGLRPTRLVNDERACRRDPRQPQGQLVGKRTTSRPGVRMAHA